MPKFLIEFRHADDYEGGVRALDVLSTLGSHLVSHADFGCEDGVHCGWMVVEVGDRNEVGHRAAAAASRRPRDPAPAVVAGGDLGDGPAASA